MNEFYLRPQHNETLNSTVYYQECLQENRKKFQSIWDNILQMQQEMKNVIREDLAHQEKIFQEIESETLDEFLKLSREEIEGVEDAEGDLQTSHRFIQMKHRLKLDGIERRTKGRANLFEDNQKNIESSLKGHNELMDLQEKQINLYWEQEDYEIKRMKLVNDEKLKKEHQSHLEQMKKDSEDLAAKIELGKLDIAKFDAQSKRLYEEGLLKVRKQENQDEADYKAECIKLENLIAENNKKGKEADNELKRLKVKVEDERARQTHDQIAACQRQFNKDKSKLEKQRSDLIAQNELELKILKENNKKELIEREQDLEIWKTKYREKVRRIKLVGKRRIIVLREVVYSD